VKIAEVNNASTVALTSAYGLGGVRPQPSVEDLTDVDVSSVSDGDVLVWDAGSSTWVAGSIPGGMVPYYIAPTETFTVPLYKQALYSMDIDNTGTLDVVGFLLEVT
jgi:hypothetical protein